MSVTLFVAPLPGTVCPNGVRILSADTERTDSPRRFRDVVRMRKRVEPFFLTHFQTGKVCRGYGEVAYELELTVTCAYDNGQKTYSFSAECTWKGERRHPHINGSSVCLGDNPPLWRRLLEHGAPCYRLMDFITDTLSYYNDRSPFFSLSRTQLSDGEPGSEGDEDEPDIIGSCSRCDEPIYDGEDYSIVDGEMACERCAENYSNYCECCEESTFSDVMPVCVRSDINATEMWCDHCVDANASNIEGEGRGEFDYAYVADRVVSAWREAHPVEGEELEA